MYRGRLWTMRQYAGFATAEETNRATSICSSRPNRALGVPSICRPRSATTPRPWRGRGRQGRRGRLTLADMETLLDGIPLDRFTPMIINAPAAVLLAM